MRLVIAMLKTRGKLLAPEHLSRFVHQLRTRSYPSAAPPPPRLLSEFEIAEEEVAGRPVFVVTPRRGRTAWRIIYTHGGGYVNSLIRPHWDIISALARATGATVIAPIYPLAPRYEHREAYRFLEAVYRWVLENADAAHLVLAGDSAGGGLAVGQALLTPSWGLPSPQRLILFAPWLDLALADPAARKLESDDPMLGVDALRYSGEAWAAGEDLKTGYLSPLHADVGALPPTDIFQGGRDLLAPDARAFAKKLRAAGRSVSYAEFHGAFHVFMAATFTPEAKQVYAEIGRLLRPGGDDVAAGSSARSPKR
jgi:epsilon-lactone hydrolase